MIYFLLAITALLASTTAVACVLAALYYGKLVSEQKLVRTLFKDKERLYTDSKMWQSKFTQSKGMGTLDAGQSQMTPVRSRIRTPSQVKEEIKELRILTPQIRSNPVPESVKNSFLADVRNIKTDKLIINQPVEN